MEKKPTEILMDEHRKIELMLQVVTRVCDLIEKGEKIDTSDLTSIIDFIRNYADKFHHAKEEDILFVELEKIGFPRNGGPVGVMLIEHDQGRSFVAQMEKAVSEMNNGNHDAAQEYAKNARNYVQLLSQHIDKEDNVLYRMADMHLDKNAQVEMLDSFKEAEEKIGSDLHEKMLNILSQMKNKYL